MIIQYLETNITENYELIAEYFDPVKHRYNIQFNISGTYIAQIRVRNELNNYSESEAKAFIVYETGEGYPKTT